MENKEMMMGELTLRQLHIGNIDAKHELLEDFRADTALFENSFFMPPHLDVDDFFAGKKSYIVGMKGTGKTALLSYISLQAKKAGHATQLVLFKSGISEEEKRKFSIMAGFSIANTDSKGSAIVQDFEDLWCLFLHQHICSALQADSKIVNHDEAFNRYRTLLSAISEEPVSYVANLFPKLQNGKLKLKANFLSILQAELQLGGKGEKSTDSAPVALIVKAANEYLQVLGRGSNKLLIFIDELEIAYGSRDQYDRDCRLIRDLVAATSKLNELSVRSRLPIQLVTAIRSEVVLSVASLGKEIDKVIEDHGVRLVWHEPSKADREQPLLAVVRSKINASEVHFGFAPSSSEEVWPKYFDQQIHQSDVREYILHRSWYRPRDIIRLLRMAQGKYPDRDKFTGSILTSVGKDYSQQSWREMTEELQAHYSTEELEGLQSVLTGFKGMFDIEELDARLKRQANHAEKVRKLAQRGIGELVQDLFRVGIVGNVYQTYANGRRQSRNRWAFRGEAQVLLDKRLAIHRGLLDALSLA